MSEFEQETNLSSWKKIYPTFRVYDNYMWGILKQTNRYGKKVYNQIRLVSIDNITYLEVKTQLKNITFICDISNYKHVRSHTWTSHKPKNSNTYYITTKIKKDNKRKTLKFHRLIHPEWNMIDHINREGTDNRECNLRKTTSKENALNRKLFKTNISGYNGISYNKFGKSWTFSWYENKKYKVKYFKTKQEAIEFKLAHDLTTGNKNGYPV
jgi:hypothetical protein